MIGLLAIGGDENDKSLNLNFNNFYYFKNHNIIFAVFRYSSLNSHSGETFMDFSHRAAVKSIQNQSKHRFIYLSP